MAEADSVPRERDAVDALAAAGFDIERVTMVPLSRLDPTGPTGSWRVDYGGVPVVKLRRCWNERRAMRSVEIGTRLGPRVAAATLSRRGRFVVSSWVPGEIAHPADVALAAELLAVVHDADAAGLDPVWPPDPVRTVQSLEVLTAHGVLTPDEAAWSRSVVAKIVLDDLVVVHGDLASENAVRAETGGFVSIDNEALDVSPRAWDLARWWYRWPSVDRTELDGLSEYERVAGVTVDDVDLVPWQVLVLVDAARHRLGTPVGPDAPLTRLREVIQRGTPSPRHESGGAPS